ncbi:hypothetical protein [Psychromonas antarctica]|uniref:hypothetical protein n=1 Tax=Psychromonas antarctica TaxID=67573 RepID=UPI001EE8229C|nr:hypothetical protein [Psychromonas antarctica]MCG6201757.1 hypothetical protein [Psychromonas antarctica]
MDSLQDKVIAKHSLERIYPKQLNLKEKKHQKVLYIHLQHYHANNLRYECGNAMDFTL